MTPSDMKAMPHACGGTLHLINEPGTFRIHGEDIPVTEYFWRCDQCSEEVVTEELAEKVEREAASVYRKQNKRLSGSEIRSLRERLGLSQDLMERALGLGPKTIVRWESERVMPNRSMDNLLRLIERDCGALLHLAELHEVELPSSCSAGLGEIPDGRRWPRTLLARLGRAAEREGTDINSYLIMIITDHLHDAEQVVEARPEPMHRGGYTSTGHNEQWLPDRHRMMSERNARTHDLAV